LFVVKLYEEMGRFGFLVWGKIKGLVGSESGGGVGVGGGGDFFFVSILL
jgi:hypothetical protein